MKQIRSLVSVSLYVQTVYNQKSVTTPFAGSVFHFENHKSTQKEVVMCVLGESSR